MKLSKIILTGVLATALSGVSFAANTVEDTTAIASVVYKESAPAAVYEESAPAAPQEIKLSELPQAIHETLETVPYEGWEAERAWMIEKDDKTMYQVEVINNEESTTLLFDENGVAIG